QHDEFSILYHVVGKGTELLSKKAEGDALCVIGPLGNGFSDEPSGECVLVGGGVGIPPLYHLARTFVAAKPASKRNIHVFLGARHKDFLLCEKEFQKLGIDLKTATDDGSKGTKGFVTALLSEHLKKNGAGARVYTCGPTPMLKAVSEICNAKKLA